MAEQSRVFIELIEDKKYMQRVSQITRQKAAEFFRRQSNRLGENNAPSPEELTWAKLMYEEDVDLITEGASMIEAADPTDAEAARAASDTTYLTHLTNALPRIFLVRGIA